MKKTRSTVESLKKEITRTEADIPGIGGLGRIIIFPGMIVTDGKVQAEIIQDEIVEIGTKRNRR